jgi:acetyl esterase/lipase
MPPLDIGHGLAAALVVSWLTVGSGLSALHAQAPRDIKDVVYATVDNTSLALDLYLPAGATPDVLLVWVHGGAWNTGSKAGVPRQLLGRAFAVASVNFRQASAARFPAQVHDLERPGHH